MSAESYGFSTDRLARIETLLREKYVETGRLPGAQFRLALRGEPVWETVVGLADVDRARPLMPDAIFRLYSMTKPVTSVALMQLVEAGKVGLDDPVETYIPAFARLRVLGGDGIDGAGEAPARPMQVIDLLRHTSGLTYGFQERTPVDAAYRRQNLEHFHAARDLAGFIDSLAGLPLDFSPGEAWTYSVSTDVCGWIVETVTGQPLSQTFRERIFDPLGMADTGFQVREGQAARLTACYEATPAGGMALQDDPATSPFLKPPAMLSGGGGLVSTASDYMRFARMLLNGGELDGARMLRQDTVRLMTLNQLPGGAEIASIARGNFSESRTPGVGFGLGFAVVTDPARTGIDRSAGEYFWGGMASTAFWIDPVEEITAVFMTQLIPSSAWPIRAELRTLTYAALTERRG